MSEGRRDPVWTVPNALSAFRLLGVAPLLWLAWGGHRRLFVGLLVVLLVSDWLDGKLAIALDQRSEFGARLDSVADWLMYAALAISVWWLLPEVIVGRRLWVAAVFGTWSLSMLVGLARFRRLPSYHTRAAKIGWLVVGVVSVRVIWTGDDAGLAWALAFVALTNVEAVAIGLVLPKWRSDVPSLWHALSIRRQEDRDGPA